MSPEDLPPDNYLRLTPAQLAAARPRYDSVAHLFAKDGKCWRFAADPEYVWPAFTWGLYRLKREEK